MNFLSRPANARRPHSDPRQPATHSAESTDQPRHQHTARARDAARGGVRAQRVPPFAHGQALDHFLTGIPAGLCEPLNPHNPRSLGILGKGRHLSQTNSPAVRLGQSGSTPSESAYNPSFSAVSSPCANVRSKQANGPFSKEISGLAALGRSNVAREGRAGERLRSVGEHNERRVAVDSMLDELFRNCNHSMSRRRVLQDNAKWSCTDDPVSDARPTNADPVLRHSRDFEAHMPYSYLPEQSNVMSHVRTAAIRDRGEVQQQEQTFLGALQTSFSWGSRIEDGSSAPEGPLHAPDDEFYGTGARVGYGSCRNDHVETWDTRESLPSLTPEPTTSGASLYTITDQAADYADPFSDDGIGSVVYPDTGRADEPGSSHVRMPDDNDGKNFVISEFEEGFWHPHRLY